MIDPEIETTARTSARRWGAAAALMAAGLAGGVVLAGTVSANAADATPTPSSSASSSGSAGSSGTPGTDSATRPQAPDGTLDPSKSQRSDETLLTGTTAEKVRAAALAAYPGATVERVETDSDGVYEAHIVTAAGDHVIVQVDESFSVTGTQTGGPGGGGAPGVDPDPDDDDGPGTGNPPTGTPPSGAPTASSSSTGTGSSA